MRLPPWGGWVAAAVVLFASHPSARADGQGVPLSVRITSPVGRTGGVGAVRFVAQVQAPHGTVVTVIRFYVDGVLLSSDEDGPPYAVEWTDENPFERRELSVEAEDGSGSTARDRVVLEPFEFVEVSDVASVLLEASVYDSKGRFINGLASGDFKVEEDGVEQTIDLISQERVPATFALLIDSSQSMARHFDFVKEAAGRLTAFLRPRDRVVVAPFTKRLTASTGPTSDHRTVVEAIEAIQPTGGTAILDAVVELSERLPPGEVEERRSIVLISDGYDEHSLMAFEDALTSVKRAGLTVYVVGIGGIAGISLKGERELRRLATETGGRLYLPHRPEELVGVYEQLAADAQNRYLVTYTPTNSARDGSWRTVALTTVEPTLVVRTRAGYLAPEPPPIRPTLEFTAMDRSGEYVDMSDDDLVVIEDGVEQKIEVFHEALTPVWIVLAIDASGSMRKSAEGLLSAATHFVEALRPQDQLALLFFSDGVVTGHDFSLNREPSLEAIAQYEPVGGTALYDALEAALARLKRVEGRRAIVVMTDGRDENNPGTAPGSAHTLNDVIALAREVDAAVLPIGLGTNVDQAGLTTLAEISGGQPYFPADVEQLREQFVRSLENLRRRYVVGYTSTNMARDGAWRNVEIRSRSEQVTIRARNGYFAPER